jgi:polyhydroxyalkanoate synthesis regulator phasin
MDKKVDEAVDAVESMCAPGFMTKQEAVDFLEDVIARLESDVDALREQIEKD